jgi:hypothetical protein
MRMKKKTTEGLRKLQARPFRQTGGNLMFVDDAQITDFDFDEVQIILRAQNNRSH